MQSRNEIMKPIAMWKKIVLLFSFYAMFTATAIAQTSTEWSLIWSDEFSGTQLNANNWTAEIGGGGWGNNELQYYTANESNVTLNDGKLHITARQENIGNYNYTSSRLITKDLMEFQYGKIEARMKLPLGAGLWPAFWMLGANISEVSWPQCGEMDIMEHINSDPGIHGTLHWNDDGHDYQGATYSVNIDEFHIYGLIWNEAGASFYVDGIIYYQFQFAAENNTIPIMNMPYFLLLNLAVGGNWPGNPNDPSVFPATMEVDYVRLYQQMISNLDPFENNLSASVYPIPFENELNITCNKPSHFIVTSMLGDVIETGTAAHLHTILNTNHFADGVYFIHFYTELGCVKVIRAIKS